MKAVLVFITILALTELAPFKFVLGKKLYNYTRAIVRCKAQRKTLALPRGEREASEVYDHLGTSSKIISSPDTGVKSLWIDAQRRDSDNEWVDHKGNIVSDFLYFAANQSNDERGDLCVEMRHMPEHLEEPFTYFQVSCAQKNNVVCTLF